jgi:uncharacterized protein (TIGR02246 family)
VEPAVPGWRAGADAPSAPKPWAAPGLSSGARRFGMGEVDPLHSPENHPMKRLVPILVVLLAPLAVRAQDDAAKQLAQKLLDAGAKTFDTKDAQAMAATWTEDALLAYVSKDESSGLWKTEVTRGREDIQRFYDKLFENKNPTTSRNFVESARMIGSDFLVIQGRFQPDTSNEGKVPFVQTRVKRDDQWLIANLQLFVLP